MQSQRSDRSRLLLADAAMVTLLGLSIGLALTSLASGQGLTSNLSMLAAPFGALVAGGAIGLLVLAAYSAHSREKAYLCSFVLTVGLFLVAAETLVWTFGTMTRSP